MFSNENGRANYLGLGGDLLFTCGSSYLIYRALNPAIFASELRDTSAFTTPLGIFYTVKGALPLAQNRHFVEAEMNALRSRNWEFYASSTLMLALPIGLGLWIPEFGELISSNYGASLAPSLLVPTLLTFRCSHDSVPDGWADEVNQWYDRGAQLDAGHGSWSEWLTPSSWREWLTHYTVPYRRS
jgi:hypothetical protein